jgi:hypothetical protein
MRNNIVRQIERISHKVMDPSNKITDASRISSVALFASTQQEEIKRIVDLSEKEVLEEIKRCFVGAQSYSWDVINFRIQHLMDFGALELEPRLLQSIPWANQMSLGKQGWYHYLNRPISDLDQYRHYLMLLKIIPCWAGLEIRLVQKKFVERSVDDLATLISDCGIEGH